MTGVAVELDVVSIVGEELTPAIRLALQRAINKTTAYGRTRAAEAVRKQVNFPASYLSPNSGRLSVTVKATKDNPFEGEISGRSRATSLAQFTKQKPLAPGKRHRNGEINVTVKPGGAKRTIKRAFLINLNNGNIGLAVRTDGAKPKGAYKPKQLGKNLWLLYGPSVDQALMAASDGRGVFEEMSPALLDYLNAEFNRQMDLLNET